MASTRRLDSKPIIMISNRTFPSLFLVLALSTTGAAQQPAIQLAPAQYAPQVVLGVAVESETIASDDEQTAIVDAATNVIAQEPAGDLAEEEKKKQTEEAKAKAEQTKRKAAEAKRKADALKRKTERLTQLKKLDFDRRPSSILKAWSTPPGEDKEAEESDEEIVAVSVKTNEGFEIRGLLRAKDDDGVIVDTLDGRRFMIPQDAIDELIEEPRDEEEKKEPTKEEKEKSAEAKKLAEEKTAFEQSVKKFQRDVTLGEWGEVKEFLRGFDEDVGKATYSRLLQSLLTGPRPQPPKPGMPAPPPVPAHLRRYLEKNAFSNEDFLALADVAPYEIEAAEVRSLSGILRNALAQGNILEELVDSLQAYIKRDDAKLNSRHCAKLILGANQPLKVAEFLPSLAEARQADDHEALNMLSQYYLALNQEEKKRENLEKAWEVTQAILASTEIKQAEKEEALKRAVELATQIKQEVGQKWLEESFTKNAERGMEIIASIGTATAQGLQKSPTDPTFRLKSLQLQHTAVEALLKSSQEQAERWKNRIALLAENWLKEGEHSYQNDESKTLLQDMQRDMYGNFFYDPYYYRNRSSNNGAKAIRTGDLLEVRPSSEWLQFVSSGIRPKFDVLYAQLYLKVAEDELAYPYIESLSKSHPDIGKDLVDEYVRVWTENHDPNASRRRTSSYMYMYGYEQKAEGIPLTRSKQQRNLEELSELVKKLKALPVELDEELLAKAFANCHSQAEVYHLEAIERVFGSLEKMEPKTLAEMAQQMRSNLLGVWRNPATQKTAKTNRKQKDIQAEVRRGYSVARAVVEDGLKKHPEDWALQLALASINHDENEYQAELEKDSKFSQRREKSFDEFRRAAEMYIATARDLEEDEETTKPFETWWYASLGAVDLGRIDDKKQPDLTQPAKIKATLMALPKQQAERHLKLLANTLFTRMSSVKPAVKYRYLKSGFEMIGDQKAAYEARKVFEYYNDLVSEIRLETELDGSDIVGQEPFGVFVNLVHTREIEREAGGFGKYLQNQNNGNSFYYNYGRPTENYRDKFEQIVTEALEEKFDILSVTFQSEEVNSRALEEYGWRVTPYAYLLLQARGPEVDQIAPVRLDLDFLDTSGYAVLPVESSIVPVDATSKSKLRPVKNLTITQTLDERQADEGKLILEVKATGQGLIPSLAEIVDVNPDEFEIANIEDQGISVSRFDPDSAENVVVSERTWMVTMAGKDGLVEHPKSFQFAAVKDPNLLAHAEDKDIPAEDAMVYQRFVDADLESVSQHISLEEQYGETSHAWIGWAVGLGLGGVALLGLIFALRPKERVERKARFEVPAEVTPFTVLGLLKDIQANNGLTPKRKTELSTSINRIEQYYFGATNGEEEPKLTEIARTWVRQAR